MSSPMVSFFSQLMTKKDAQHVNVSAFSSVDLFNQSDFNWQHGASPFEISGLDLVHERTEVAAEDEENRKFGIAFDPPSLSSAFQQVRCRPLGWVIK